MVIYQVWEVCLIFKVVFMVDCVVVVVKYGDIVFEFGL